MRHEDDWVRDPAGWRQAYAEAGYLVVPNALAPDLLGQLRQALERIELQVADGSIGRSLRRHVTLDSERIGERWGQSSSDSISNIMELPLFDPIFRDLIIYPRVLDVLEALFESSEFSFHNYKCIAKMPGSDAPFRWHRDLPYLEHTSPNLITCMLCIDDMTEDNGATVVCPGSHLIPPGQLNPQDVDIDESQLPGRRTSVICPAGSAVLFHVNIIHGGPANRSQSKRRNVIGIWAGPDAYPTTSARFCYEFVMPRSADTQRQKQIAMTFGGD